MITLTTEGIMTNNTERDPRGAYVMLQQACWSTRRRLRWEVPVGDIYNIFMLQLVRISQQKWPSRVARTLFTIR